MNKVRLGIIGMGNMGKYHAEYLLNGKVTRCELVAISTTNPAISERYRSLRIFNEGEQLIQSGLLDAVLIATPHLQHTSLGMAAFKAGIHAMIEKPISAHKADAERLTAAHKESPQLVFAGMFQLRAEPRYLAIRKLIRDGGLGEIVRINWINTDWYRTDVYYASSEWRATWKGEGGGVLLNQCLHNLDILQWLCGMPARLRGFCQMGRFHQIEVEDSVAAYLEWANSATGVFVSSTGETPGTNRFEIIGTRGKLVLENERLMFTRNEVDMVEFNRTASHGFAKPDAKTSEIPFENATLPHAALMQNFVDAILDGAALLAPGADGIHSVELANAAVYSSLAGSTLDLPMDGAAWEARLNRLISESKFKKNVLKTDSQDFASSFRK